MSERERVPECVERWRGLPASVRDYAGKLIAYTATPEGLIARDCLEYLATAAPAPSVCTPDCPHYAELRTIAERDVFEEAIVETARNLGCREEWSSEHDHAKCIVELSASLGTPAPVKFDARAPELAAQWEPPAQAVHVRADGSVIDSVPSDWRWMALEAWRWIAYARIQLGPSRFDLDDTGHLVDKPVTPAPNVADDPAKPWPRECAAQYLPDTVRADGSKMDLPAEPEPRGCPTPGACAAVAAGWSLASEPIATEAQNDRWDALTVRLERLAAEIAPLRDEAEVRAEALKPVREALLTAGYCGDGDVAAMVTHAIASAKHRSEQLLADAIQDTCAVVDAVAPRSSGTLAERTTAALAKVRAEGAGWMRRQCEDAIDSVTHGYAEPAVSKSVAMAAKVAIRALPIEREDR